MEEGKESVKDLVVEVSSSEVSIALMENHRLIEFNKESVEGHSFSVGDVYLGKVKKLLPALNAAFVDIGDEKEAFIHYLDLGLYFNAFDEFVKRANPNADLKGMYSHIKIGAPLEKEGRIEKVLTPGQLIIVQIVKEPISTKGSRLTAEISLAGRNIVLLPFADKVSISQKIASKEERRRLETLVKSILPKNYGVIIRTAAEGRNAAVLDAELMSLIGKWESSWKKISTFKKVQMLFTEYSKTTTILRDLLNDSFSNIYINDERIFEETRKYISLISPDQEKIVKLYQGREPIFDHFEVTRQIKSSFGKVVPIRQGAYLVIEHTEALHVVDVNSGNRTRNKDGQEANALDVNLGAADELARQLRLRDMGGIIVVDFIDMKLAEDRQKLYEHMCENMKRDRARHNILPLSKFGLMQITRQRVRPVMDVKVDETCPTCHGTGTIKSSFLFDKVLEGKIELLYYKLGIKNFTLHVHPYVAAYLNQGLLSIKKRWQWRFGFGVKVIPSQKLAFLQYEFYDAQGQEIDMKEEVEIR